MYHKTVDPYPNKSFLLFPFSLVKVKVKVKGVDYIEGMGTRNGPQRWGVWNKASTNDSLLCVAEEKES